MQAALCIMLVAGTLTHTLDTDRLRLIWRHSVEGTLWEEDYRAVTAGLVIEEARVVRSGAGMEPPPTATWAGGWWRYVPRLGPLPEVLLANSPSHPGYSICIASTCRPLHDLVPPGVAVKLTTAHCALGGPTP